MNVFIPTPNGLVETTKLNILLRKLEQDPFYEYIDSNETGFTVGFDAKWELTIKFKNKTGFIVLNESSKDIHMYIYEYLNQPVHNQKIIINSFKTINTSGLIDLIKDIYVDIIKTYEPSQEMLDICYYINNLKHSDLNDPFVKMIVKEAVERTKIITKKFDTKSYDIKLLNKIIKNKKK